MSSKAGKVTGPRPNVIENKGDGRSPQSTPISRRRALTFIAAGGGVAAAILAVAVFGRNYLAGNTSPATTTTTTPAKYTNCESNKDIIAGECCGPHFRSSYQ